MGKNFFSRFLRRIFFPKSTDLGVILAGSGEGGLLYYLDSCIAIFFKIAQKLVLDPNNSHYAARGSYPCVGIRSSAAVQYYPETDKTLANYKEAHRVYEDIVMNLKPFHMNFYDSFGVF